MTKMKEERKGWKKKIEKEKPKHMRSKNWMKKKNQKRKVECCCTYIFDQNAN